MLRVSKILRAFRRDQFNQLTYIGRVGDWEAHEHPTLGDEAGVIAIKGPQMIQTDIHDMEDFHHWVEDGGVWRSAPNRDPGMMGEEEEEY